MKVRKQKEHAKKANLVQHLRHAHAMPHSRFFWRDKTLRQVERIHDEKHAGEARQSG